MRVFCSVITPSTALTALLNPEIASSRAIRPQIISDKAFWNKAAFLEQLAHQLQRSALIPFRLDKHIENLAFGIYGSPQIGHATVDLEVDLVQMLGGVGPGGRRLRKTDTILGPK